MMLTRFGKIAYWRKIIDAQRNVPSFAHLMRAAYGDVSYVDDDSLSAALRKQIESLRAITNNGLLVVAPLTLVEQVRIVVPAVARPHLLIRLHEQSGHYSGEANLATSEKSFWWPGMAQEVREVARACRTCQEARRQNST
jgi:hypothetical protein